MTMVEELEAQYEAQRKERLRRDVEDARETYERAKLLWAQRKDAEAYGTMQFALERLVRVVGVYVDGLDERDAIINGCAATEAPVTATV